MKTINILFILIFTISINAQDNPPNKKELMQGVEALQSQFESLKNYYDQYDKKTSKKEKKDALDTAVDDLYGKGNVSEKEKNDTFKIVDAYISADKAPSKPQKQIKQQKIEDNPEIKRQAKQQFNAAKNKLLAMSYPEYETHIYQFQPMVSKREIKESYNQLHKDDGRGVNITSKDDELTETQKQINAINQINNAKTYLEYREGVKVIYKNISEEDIRKAWKEKNN